MNASSENHQNLERLIHHTLRELAPRRAPRSLESRVRVELERRAALPWWQQSFAHWPAAARIAFLGLGAGVVKIVLMATVWVMAGFDAAQFKAAFAPQYSWMETGFAVVSAGVEFFDIAARNIPPPWLHGITAIVAASYAALFCLGASAYRTLYVNR